MDEKALFTRFWTKESKTTRNVIARIPESSEYRPDPRPHTAKEIAWQVVCEEKMIIEALENSKAEWNGTLGVDRAAELRTERGRAVKRSPSP